MLLHIFRYAEDAVLRMLDMSYTKMIGCNCDTSQTRLKN